MAQFPLKMNGAEVCTIEDVKKNLNPKELIAYRNRFAAWLKGWDYDEEAMEVVSLDPELTDEDWLEAICQIIGISEEELKASRKKEEDAAKKQEKMKVEAAAKEEQKRKVKQEKKKKLEPTPQNIHVEFCSRKFPFMDTVSKVFTCEKGVLVKTKTDYLYFSNDGEDFSRIVPHDDSYHYYTSFSCVGDYLFFCDNEKCCYSKNGEDWNYFDFKDVIPDNAKDFDSPYYRKMPTFENIVYDANQKRYVIFYYFYRDVGVNDDITQVYCCASAKYLDCSWTDWGEIGTSTFSFLKPENFCYINGKFYASVSDGQEKYGYDAKYSNGVYYSTDGIKWKQADESDQKWLDGLEFDDGYRWTHIDYCNCKDGLKRYFLEGKDVASWKGNYFSLGDDDDILAWKEGYDRQSVSDECDFSISRIACFNGKLLIFGENNEFAIGEIRVKGK